MKINLNKYKLLKINADAKLIYNILNMKNIKEDINTEVQKKIFCKSQHVCQIHGIGQCTKRVQILSQ